MEKYIYDEKNDLGFHFFCSQLPSDKLIVLFFGGGWVKRNIHQFEPFAEELIKIGFNVALCDYRVSRIHEGIMVKDCIEDSFKAIEYIKLHSGELGISKDKIIVGGGSAGGHIALCLAILDNNTEYAGLLLFNPVVDTDPDKGFNNPLVGLEWKSVSPTYLLNKKLPPIFIVHGDNDTTVKPESVINFCEKARSFGSAVTIYWYPNEQHSFFNYGKPAYKDVLEKTLNFCRNLEIV